jgi:hypothetical protein
VIIIAIILKHLKSHPTSKIEVMDAAILPTSLKFFDLLFTESSTARNSCHPFEGNNRKISVQGTVIVTKLKWNNWGLILSKGKESISSPPCPKSSGALPASCPMVLWLFLKGI